VRVIQIVERHLGRGLGHKWLEMAADIGDAGGCPAATHFLCFAKESKQRKATRVHRRAKKPRGSLCYSRAKAAAELALRKRFVVKVNIVAQSSDSPRRNLLHSLRCSATLNGNSEARRATSDSLLRGAPLHPRSFPWVQGKAGMGLHT
jgi:hypothetical protein